MLKSLPWLEAFEYSVWGLDVGARSHMFADGTQSLINAIAADAGGDVRLSTP